MSLTLRSAGQVTLRIDVDDGPAAARVLAGADGVALMEGGSGEPRGVLRVQLSPPATAAGVNAALVSAGVAVSALVSEQATLEDVFLSLTGGDDVPR